MDLVKNVQLLKQDFDMLHALVTSNEQCLHNDKTNQY